MRRRLSRCVCILLWLFFLVLSASGCQDSNRQERAEEPADEPTYRGVIVAMGDSLTAGLGVGPQQSYPHVLERRLSEAGYPYRVINAGVSGETSSGALARVDWLLKMQPDIVILETGANDGLRGIDPGLVRANIDRIIWTLKESGAIVVLAGMQMVANLGPEYLEAFNTIYPELAAKHQVGFIPFFLEGVAMRQELNQADGIHPNAAGYARVVENLQPYVIDAIKQLEAQKAVDQP